MGLGCCARHTRSFFSPVCQNVGAAQSQHTHVASWRCNTWIPLPQMCHVFPLPGLLERVPPLQRVMCLLILKSSSSVKPADWARMQPSKPSWAPLGWTVSSSLLPNVGTFIPLFIEQVLGNKYAKCRGKVVNRKTRLALMGQYYDAFSFACVITFISVFSN